MSRPVRRSRRRRPYYGRIAVFVLLVLALLGGIIWGITGCINRGEPNTDAESSLSDSESSLSDPESSLPEESELPEESSASQSEPSSQSEAEANKANTDFLENHPGWSDFVMPLNGNYNLILVNKENVLPEEIPEIAGMLSSVGDFQFNTEALPQLKQMMADAKSAGLPLAMVSAYRPLSRSAVLYKNKTQEYITAGYSTQEASTEAAKWVAPPGTSEHATGLAVDIVSGDYYTKMSDLEQEFETFPEAKWLKEHCAEYGFILRFPKGKEDITQVNYEPWHFRYVGVEHASAIMDGGLTLEEYLDQQ